MYDISDLRATIVPKSDQLNAEQLLGGPLTVRVTEVRIGSSDEQPISIHYVSIHARAVRRARRHLRKPPLMHLNSTGSREPLPNRSSRLVLNVSNQTFHWCGAYLGEARTCRVLEEHLEFAQTIIGRAVRRSQWL